MSKVEFLTSMKRLAELYPPVPSGKMMPEWLRKAPTHLPYRMDDNTDVKTIKTCPGVVDLVSQGYIMPAWTDFVLDRRVDEHGDSSTINTGWRPDMNGHFLEEQVIMNPPEGHSKYVLKIDGPWLMITEPGWSTLVLPLPYSEEHRFNVMPGIIDTDIAHQMNFIFTLPNPGRVEIEAGDPIFQMIPFKREKFDMEVTVSHERHEELYNAGTGALEGGRRLITGGYRKYRAKHRKETERCPVNHNG